MTQSELIDWIWKRGTAEQIAMDGWSEPTRRYHYAFRIALPVIRIGCICEQLTPNHLVALWIATRETVMTYLPYDGDEMERLLEHPIVQGLVNRARAERGHQDD